MVGRCRHSRQAKKNGMVENSPVYESPRRRPRGPQGLNLHKNVSLNS